MDQMKQLFNIIKRMIIPLQLKQAVIIFKSDTGVGMMSVLQKGDKMSAVEMQDLFITLLHQITSREADDSGMVKTGPRGLVKADDNK